MGAPPASVHEMIVQACQEHDAAGGVHQGVLEQQLNHVPQQELLSALNQLMTQGKVVAATRIDDQKLVFRLQNDQEVARLRGLSAEDRLIYQEIEKSAGSGISTKDLKTRTGMQPTPLNKVLKLLETRKLVRPIKSVSAKNKKLYILFETEPSKEVTGGAWYTPSTQEFDHELITSLQEVSLNYITQQPEGGATAQQVHDFIRDQGVVRGKPLQLADIRAILESLVYDARLEQVRDPYTAGRRENAMYKPVLKMDSAQGAYTSVPCAVCPSFRECREDGEVCPSKCEYMTRWLEHAAGDLSW